MVTNGIITILPVLFVSSNVSCIVFPVYSKIWLISLFFFVEFIRRFFKSLLARGKKVDSSRTSSIHKL